MGIKRLLITGSNGLLGQKLVNSLKHNPNYELLATSKGENRMKDKDGYQYLSLDITNKNEVKAVFDTFRPDVLINTAAMTNVDACETDKEACWLLNVTAVAFMLESAEKYQTHFIHLSTDFVFDGENGPYKEEDPTNPLSYYGQSKLASEKLVEHAKTKSAIVRTIIVYGVADEMSRSNIVLWAKQALEKKQALTIVNDQFRSPTLAEDLADGCILIADKEAEGIYHISGKDIMSIVELVKRVADFFELDASTIKETTSDTLNQAAKRPPKTGFILKKADTQLGYKPHSFEEGLKILSKQLA